MYYIHKHCISLEYGGAEEGGWWYEHGTPENNWNAGIHSFITEEAAYATCRALNDSEHDRRKREEQYDYTSVLAHMSNHYSYSVEDTWHMKPYPEVRPHYE